MTVVKSGYVLAENELYSTEPWATRALLRHLSVASARLIWEPFAGRHAMADVMVEAGGNVFTSDIADYGRQHDQTGDFFQSEPFDCEAFGVDMIITNPPYGKQNRLAATVARRCLERCDGWVALLLTAKFDSGSTRVDLFRDNPRFVAKIVLTDRIQWFPGKYGSTEDHSWFLWGPQCTFPRRPTLLYEGKSGNE